jgi:hypothetical protein
MTATRPSVTADGDVRLRVRFGQVPVDYLHREN